jgi:hypothetical protein
MNPVTLSLSKGVPVMVRHAHHDRNERPRISISYAKLNKALPPQVSCDISLDTARAETHPHFVRSGETGEGKARFGGGVPGLCYAKDSSDIPVRRRQSHDSCIGLSGGL